MKLENLISKIKEEEEIFLLIEANGDYFSLSFASRPINSRLIVIDKLDIDTVEELEFFISLADKFDLSLEIHDLITESNLRAKIGKDIAKKQMNRHADKMCHEIVDKIGKLIVPINKDEEE